MIFWDLTKEVENYAKKVTNKRLFSHLFRKGKLSSRFKNLFFFLFEQLGDLNLSEENSFGKILHD